jgi:hypothetical protein
VRSAAGKAYNHRARASQRCGIVRFDTGHSGTGLQLGIVHLDTACWGTENSGSDLPDTAAGIRNTVAGRRSCSYCTCGLRADDGDAGDVAAGTGTGEQREEEAASGEALRDRRPYRRLGHQILPVYSAQPADGGYSSCRLGD